jgi:hypothetical protein
MQQHSFNGEAGSRKAHVVVGETKLPQLLQWLRKGTVVFLPHQVEGNRTTTQWVETKDGNEWRKDIPHFELIALARQQNAVAA